MESFCHLLERKKTPDLIDPIGISSAFKPTRKFNDMCKAVTWPEKGGIVRWEKVLIMFPFRDDQFVFKSTVKTGTRPRSRFRIP
jgi:hypothetical protein